MECLMILERSMKAEAGFLQVKGFACAVRKIVVVLLRERLVTLVGSYTIANVMWQPVEFEKDGQPSVRIAFFAKRHIPPLTELRYDYEISYDTGEVDEDGSMVFRGKRVCVCGSGNCRGSFEWNYEPELVGEDCWYEASEVYKLRSEILVSARAIGNVSRMANQPSICIAFFAKRHIPPLTELRDNYGMYYNTGEVDEDRSMVFRDCWDEVSEVYKLRSEILPVEFEKDGQPLVRIAFFAKRHIPPLTEVRYDYGMSYDTGEVDEDGSMIFRGKRSVKNHSCSASVMWQPVEFEKDGQPTFGFTFAIDESTPIEATPFSYLIPSFADNDNHQMENISSPTSQVVTPLQSPNGPIKRGRGRCNGMSYDTGKVDEDGNMIFRERYLFGIWCYVSGKASLSSSDPTGLDSVRDEPEEGMEDQDEFFIEDCCICTA
ncbi:hypothetical protein HID58_090202 [Brassica napus]|uniref:Post-SET domain-containing protein n=1 Tax=Brassica napus TaxID=3708 RepID=A0ABQ7WYG2_BRANA|nr:hypothetical protein HID58_090202 [Brassica napus]